MFGSLIDTARVNRDRKYVKENLAYKETVNPAYKETLAVSGWVEWGGIRWGGA
jgi:hypothetical protein